MAIVNYIGKKYRETYGENIDEMKMHKLLYFAQRESLIEYNRPLFAAEIHGWKYGPVIPDVRKMFSNGVLLLCKSIYEFNNEENIKLLDEVFSRYAAKNSWSLSRLTHGEYSWKQSRIGIAENENSDNEIKVDDIRKDATRVKERRNILRILEGR